MGKKRTAGNQLWQGKTRRSRAGYHQGNINDELAQELQTQGDYKESK